MLLHIALISFSTSWAFYFNVRALNKKKHFSYCKIDLRDHSRHRNMASHFMHTLLLSDHVHMGGQSEAS